MDREWFQVCRNGSILADDLNEDSAFQEAQIIAEESDAPVMVVRMLRTDVRSYQRQVTVSSQDLTTAAP